MMKKKDNIPIAFGGQKGGQIVKNKKSVLCGVQDYHKREAWGTKATKSKNS